VTEQEDLIKTKEEQARIEEAEAVFKQKIAEQKRVLKTLSKNQLIRIVVDMSVRAFYQQAELEDLKEALNAQSYIPDLADIAAQQSSTGESEPRSEDKQEVTKKD